MVFKDDCTQLILNTFPDFAESKVWTEYLENCEGLGFYIEIDTFSDLVCDYLNSKERDVHITKKIFDFTEMLMVEEDYDVQNAFATCFLENLLNYYSAGRVEAIKFTPLLGHESRAYCKAWDEFTKVTTPGV